MATTTAASNYLELELLDHVFGGASYTPPSNVYLALFTAAPSDTGGGTEVTGGSYARQAVSFAASSAGTAATDDDVTFTAIGDEVTHVGLFDASTSGNLLFWGVLEAAVDPGGDDFVIYAGDLTVTLAYGSTSGISTGLADELLDHVLRSESYSPPSDVEVALWEASAEVSGGSYARKVSSWGTAASGSIATTAAIEWPNLPTCEVEEVRAYEDAASGGMHLWSWEITPKAFTAGAKATLGVGALTATID